MEAMKGRCKGIEKKSGTPNTLETLILQLTLHVLFLGFDDFERCDVPVTVTQPVYHLSQLKQSFSSSLHLQKCRQQLLCLP